MARKPGPGICVHCLSEVQERNWDHVFPRSWYPDTTPQNIEKWKIPSCIKCNSEYGRMEDELGIILSTCIDPKSSYASGIWMKTLRALDPSQGETEKDKQARQRKKEELLGKILKGDDIPSHGIYPGLGERWGRSCKKQRAILVPATYLQKLAEKIVKGLAFIEDGRLIGKDMEIEHHVVNEVGSRLFEENVTQYGSSHSCGPGIEVVRAVTPEDGVSALYKIIVWGEIVMYVTVKRRTIWDVFQSRNFKILLIVVGVVFGLLVMLAVVFD